MQSPTSLAQVKTLEGFHLADALSLIAEADSPLIFKGLCKDWPLVKAGVISASSAADYLRQFYQRVTSSDR